MRVTFIGVVTMGVLLCFSGCGREKQLTTETGQASFAQIKPNILLAGGQKDQLNQAAIVGQNTLLIINAPGGDASENRAQTLAETYPNLRTILILTNNKKSLRDGYNDLRKAFPSMEVLAGKATLNEAIKEGLVSGRSLEKEESIDLGGQEAQLLPLGQAASNDDAVVYLPKEQVLFSGGLVLSKEIPELNDGDTAQWINRLQELSTKPIAQIIPASGVVGDLELINWTRQYLVLLRSQICMLRGQNYADDDIYYFIQIPGYEKFTHGNERFKDNVNYVIKEIREKGNICTLPTKELPSWGPVTIEEVRAKNH